MSKDLREIAMLLLEAISEMQDNNPYANAIDFEKVVNTPHLLEYKPISRKAVMLLEEDKYVKCFFNNDNSIFAIGISEKGVKRLEQRKETQYKPSEIEKIIKKLISESNPDRPREMEMPDTNAFYSKVNNAGDSDQKIKYLEDVLQGIEDYFISKWKSKERAGNYVNGLPLKYWKSQVKEFYIYKMIQRMIEKLIDNPKYIFPQHFNTFKGSLDALERYKKEIYKKNRDYWESHLFVDIIEIKEYLIELGNIEDKLDFLTHHIYELEQIRYHYTDDNIETILKKHSLNEKFQRVEYSPMADYSHDHVSQSEYREFLRLLNNHIIPFLRIEKSRLEEEFRTKGGTKSILDAFRTPVTKVNEKKQIPEITEKLDNTVHGLSNNIFKAVESSFKPIQWLGSKRQMLELFRLLSEKLSGYTPAYNEDEILSHFVDLKGNKYLNDNTSKVQKLQWLKTDGNFWQLVNHLVEHKFIKKQKKYQTFIPHFLNNELKSFKNPAQTNFFKKNFLNPDENLIEIIRKVILIKD